MPKTLSPRDIAEETFSGRLRLRARMTCARLSNVAGGEDLGHQLSQTYMSLPLWARDRLTEIGKDLVLRPADFGATVFDGPYNATLTTLWLQRGGSPSDEDVFVAIFLASATATGQGKDERRRQITRGAHALPGTLRETPMTSEEKRATIAPYNVANAEESDKDTSNWFTDVFSALVNRHQPSHLHVSAARRMIRALRFMGDIQATLERSVHRYVDGSGRTVDPSSTEGRLELSVQGLFSAMDRDNLVQAQVGGKFSRTKENHLTITYAALPPGWRREGTSTRPEVDPAAAPLVRLLVHAMGYESREVLRQVIRASRMVSPRVGPVDRWIWDPIAVEEQLCAFGLPVVHAPAPRTVTTQDDRLFADAGSLDVHRLSRWLQAWEHQVYEWEMRLPEGTRVSVDGIRHWQEASGRTIALMEVHLPVPKEPFASAGELRRARAALDGWTAEAGVRSALIRDAQSRGRLPFLGAVGAYGSGGFEYRLMSSRASGRHAYDLRRQPKSGERLVWRSSTATLGERCAMVWADELHHAVADVAASLLRAGMASRPAAEARADYAPVLPLFRRRRKAVDPVRQEMAALDDAERARRLAFDMLGEPPIGDPDDYRARIRQHLAKAEADIQAVRARIAAIEASKDVAADERESPFRRPHAHSFSSELEGLLLVIDRFRGAPLVPGQFADGTQEWLRVRVERADLRWVDFSVELMVPGPDDSVLTLGPGHGRVPARGWSLPTSAGEQPVTSRKETLERYEAARSAHIAEQIMAHGSDLVSLLPASKGADTPTSAWGRKPRLNAAAHLASVAHQQGLDLGHKAAAVALRNPLSEVRLAIWHALQGLTPPDTLDPHFAAYVARAYLGSAAVPNWSSRTLTRVERGDTAAWAHHHAPTATVMAHLARQPNAAARTSEVKQIVGRAGGKPNTIANLLGGTARTEPLLQRRPCERDDCHRNCRRHGTIGLRPCPHQDCAGWLDTPARIFEVPAGVLCSRCCRMPDSDSPVFPAEYLTAAERHLDSLMHYAPDVLAQRARNGRSVPDAWLEREADCPEVDRSGAA